MHLMVKTGIQNFCWKIYEKPQHFWVILWTRRMHCSCWKVLGLTATNGFLGVKTKTFSSSVNSAYNDRGQQSRCVLLPWSVVRRRWSHTLSASFPLACESHQKALTQFFAFLFSLLPQSKNPNTQEGNPLISKSKMIACLNIIMILFSFISHLKQALICSFFF